MHFIVSLHLQNRRKWTEKKAFGKTFIVIAYSMKMMYNHTSSQTEESDMDLTGRHFLKLLDYTPEEIGALLELAAKL